MSLRIVNSKGGPWPLGTWVYRYDQGYLKARMKRLPNGNLKYMGDEDNAMMVPLISGDPYTIEITPQGKGCYSFEMVDGELRKKGTFIETMEFWRGNN